MADELMYILNLLYPFCRLQLVVETFNTELNEQTNLGTTVINSLMSPPFLKYAHLYIIHMVRQTTVNALTEKKLPICILSAAPIKDKRLIFLHIFL